MKAVTYHKFSLAQENGIFKATFVMTCEKSKVSVSMIQGGA